MFLLTTCVHDIDGRTVPVAAPSPTPPTPTPTVTRTPPPQPIRTPEPTPSPPPTPEPPEPDDDFPFVTKWQVKNIGGEIKIVLPLPEGFIYDFGVDWGDNSRARVNSWNDGNRVHYYRESGEYTVEIFGVMQAWDFEQFPHSRDQLIAVPDLGSVGWLDMNGAFYECDNLTEVVARKGEVTRGVRSMARMFAGADLANPDVSNWDISAVEDLSGMFENTGAAMPDVSNWETSNATNMAAMFEDAAAIDELQVTGWDTSRVTNMSRMFANTGSEGSMDKTPYLVEWDYSKVRSMEGMLIGQTLPTESYSSMLDKIAEGKVMKGVYFDAGNSQYNVIGARAKNKLTGNSNWTIYDGGAGLE